MELIDRRALARGILFGATVSAAGLALSPGGAIAMPLDDGIPGALDDWIEKTQAVSSLRVRVAGLGAASGVAGGIEAAGSAVGAGCDLTHCISYIPFAFGPPAGSARALPSCRKINLMD
jgi:hypothetical protein